MFVVCGWLLWVLVVLLVVVSFVVGYFGISLWVVLDVVVCGVDFVYVLVVMLVGSVWYYWGVVVVVLVVVCVLFVVVFLMSLVVICGLVGEDMVRYVVFCVCWLIVWC